MKHSSLPSHRTLTNHGKEIEVKVSDIDQHIPALIVDSHMSTECLHTTWASGGREKKRKAAGNCSQMVTGDTIDRDKVKSGTVWFCSAFCSAFCYLSKTSTYILWHMTVECFKWGFMCEL